MDFDSPTTQALLSIALISFAPVLVLLGLPVNNQILMRRFLALAAGCLLADAFLHLIPESDGLQQAIAAAASKGLPSSHAHDHHSHPAKRAVDDEHHHHHHHNSLYEEPSHHHQHHNHAHDHHHHPPHHHHHDHEENSHEIVSSSPMHDHHHHHHDSTTGFRVLWGILIFFFIERILCVFRLESATGNHAHEDVDDYKNSDVSKPNTRQSAGKKKKDDEKQQITNTNNAHSHHNPIHAFGILNLIADFMHNFTDGLAIGASFATNTKLGMSTTVAIFLHEIPHEISDYAILIQSGFSKTKAIWLQCVTAVGAFSGCIVAIYAGNLDSNANAWILPITAGGFIYIAMVHLLPQLKSSNFKNTVLELSLLVLGVTLMLGVSYFE